MYILIQVDWLYSLFFCCRIFTGNFVCSVAKKFCSEYGCVRLSIGEVLRRIMEKFPQSKLAELIDSQLKSGQAVPEDLCMYALESALLDVDCKTRG